MCYIFGNFCKIFPITSKTFKSVSVLYPNLLLPVIIFHIRWFHSGTIAQQRTQKQINFLTSI